MDNWKKLPNNRRLKQANGYSVILPEDLPEVIPLECPKCNLLMRDHDDVLSYKVARLCSECYLDDYSSLNEGNVNPSPYVRSNSSLSR